MKLFFVSLIVLVFSVNANAEENNTELSFYSGIFDTIDEDVHVLGIVGHGNVSPITGRELSGTLQTSLRFAGIPGRHEQHTAGGNIAAKAVIRGGLTSDRQGE